MVSTLQSGVNFLKEFGVFDVLLPFLLVFTLVYAILEKTRILGTEKIAGVENAPRRPLNTSVAFVVAMLVVATNKIVTAINTALPNVVLLLVVILSFLMLVGIFYKEGEFDFKKDHGTWLAWFVGILFLSIAGIFLDSITYNGETTWWDIVWNYVVNNYSSTVAGAIVMLIISIAAIAYVTDSFGGKKPAAEGGGSTG